MKILQANKFYPPDIGGVETVVRDIAEGLCDYVNMRVLVCQKKGQRVCEIVNGVSVFRAASWGTFFSMPLSVDFLMQYRKMSRCAEVVQLHSPFPLADLAVWLFRPKGKLVVWWHSDIIRQKFLRRILAPLIKHTLQRADAILVADERLIEASHYLPSVKNKCVVIPFGLDFSAYPIPMVGFLRLNRPGQVKLLFVGRLVYYKGIDVLIEAMKSVQGAELFIVGNGKLEGALKKSVRDAGMEECVHFMDSLLREDLLAAYYDCDVFVFSSVAKSETFGICQLEAMFYGKPVINTDLPTAVPSVSVHGETGLTVPPGNAEALAQAINKLVVNEDLRLAYGMAAAQRVRDKYDRIQMIKKVQDCYENCL